MIKNLIFTAIIIYLIIKLYPFYQRYWASCIDQVGGGCGPGKKYVDNLETIAYGLSFNEAEEFASELKKGQSDRINLVNQQRKYNQLNPIK